MNCRCRENPSLHGSIQLTLAIDSMIAREIIRKFRRSEICRNPVGVGPAGSSFPQGGSSLATLGWVAQSFQDWADGRRLMPVVNISTDAGSVSPSPWGEGRDEGGRGTNFPITGGSFQTPAQFRRIACAVPNGQHFDFGVCFVDNEINRVRPAKHTSLASSASGFGESKRLGRNRRNNLVRFQGKSNSQPFGLALISGHSFPKFKSGFRVVNDPESHFLYLSSISSRNCSHGMPRPGFFSASSARRSSSAICSGVSSSSNLSRSCSNISRCSSNGSLSICSKTWAALMATIYSIDLFAQAGAGPAPKSAIHNRQSAIFP